MRIQAKLAEKDYLVVRVEVRKIKLARNLNFKFQLMKGVSRGESFSHVGIGQNRENPLSSRIGITTMKSPCSPHEAAKPTNYRPSDDLQGVLIPI
jgi:hypothetical protein